ncbi:MAG: hypothetical protein IT462_17545 [Planctomycetes bacterium]|nr:hypothetical protein [Planctomycetota bacterium]
MSTLSDSLAAGDAKAISALFINQPTAAERPAFDARIKALADHRNSRLGRAFFAALRGAPVVSNLPASATRAWLSVHWPLPDRCAAALNVSWRRRDGAWLIDTLALNLSGTALASCAAAAPYFGAGAVDAAFLDEPEIDKLIPADAFEADAGAFEAAISDLRDVLTGAGAREDKLAALARHSDDEAFLKALRAADADAARRWALWDGLKRDWENSAHWPALSGVPRREGARADCGYTGANDASAGKAFALRLKAGRVNAGGEAVVPPKEAPKDTPKKEEPGQPKDPPTDPPKERRHDKTRKSE